MNRSLVLAGVCVFLVVAVATGIGAGDQHNESVVADDSEESAWDDLVMTLLTPFIWLTEKLTNIITGVFADYPDVTQPWISDMHSKVFRVALVLSTVCILWIGVQHFFNQVAGVRRVGYVIGALGIGGVAPSLLVYPVELSRLTTEALAPVDPHFVAVGEASLQMALILVIDAFVLLGIALIFVIRNFYLILGVVLAPLLALLMVTPTLRRFGALLVNTWVAFLLIGPLNAAVFDLVLQLLEHGEGLPHWLWALGGLIMLLGVPLSVLSAGAIMVSPAFSLASRASGAIRNRASGFVKKRFSGDSNDVDQGSRERGTQRRRGDNRFRGGDD